MTPQEALARAKRWQGPIVVPLWGLDCAVCGLSARTLEISGSVREIWHRWSVHPCLPTPGDDLWRSKEKRNWAWKNLRATA